MDLIGRMIPASPMPGVTLTTWLWIEPTRVVTMDLSSERTRSKARVAAIRNSAYGGQTISSC